MHYDVLQYDVVRRAATPIVTLHRDLERVVSMCLVVRRGHVWRITTYGDEVLRSH